MWALRRASTSYLKTPGLNVAAFRAYAGVIPISNPKENKSNSYEPHVSKVDSWVTSPAPKKSSLGYRSLSSQAIANVGGEENDELEDGFSEVETSEASETIEGDLVVGESISASLKTNTMPPLVKFILEVSGISMFVALNKYFVGKELNRFELYQSMLKLCRLKLFKKALQLTDWLKGRNDFEFTERDYANMLDLIAKVHGLPKAESYMNDIPESFRQESVYRTLLANYVSATLLNKSEQLLNQMKNLGFPMTSFTCNQLLLLYKRCDKRKIYDVLSLMEKENIKPNLFTYQVLIDTKGKSRDIQGMEHIVEKMKAEGLNPTVRMQTLLARHYGSAGFASKAETVLKDLEENDSLQNSHFLRSLMLPIYANLGNYEEVDRIWRDAELRSPQQAEFLAAISAYGKLKNVKKAESIFDEMKLNYEKLSSRHYTVMLKVYAENKMLSKGKELLKQMEADNCYIGQPTWDALVKLYVDVGEVEKADSMLQCAVQENNQFKPMFTSYMNVLHEYSKRGDVHNAERIFQKMRLAGYVSRAQPFSVLVQTYINGKVPAYGIQDRMRGDKLYPNKGLSAQLALLESFIETTVD